MTRTPRQTLRLVAIACGLPLIAVLGVVMMLDEWATGEAFRRGANLLRAEDPTGFQIEMACQVLGLLFLLGLGGLFLWSERFNQRSERDITRRLAARQTFDNARRSGPIAGEPPSTGGA